MLTALKPSDFTIVKVSATGNDFLVVDLRTPARIEVWEREFGSLGRPELVRKWCDRHEELGADGLAFLRSDSQYDFAWDFYNSDGNIAEMCGNAARAVSLYVANQLQQSTLHFRTLAGPVRAKILSSQEVEVELPPIRAFEWNETAQGLAFDFIIVGVPHAVVKVPEVADREQLRSLAAQVKRESRFAQSGVNVTFLQERGTGQVASVTFERGVEDFTQSCGTGAVAAAFGISKGREAFPVQVRVPGGHLTVVWKEGRPQLSGPAKIVAEMRLIRPEG